MCTRAYLAAPRPFRRPAKKPVVPLFARPTTSFILSRLFLDRHSRLHRAHRASHIVDQDSAPATRVSFSSIGSTDRRAEFDFAKNPKSDIYITVTGRRPAARGAIDYGGKYRTVSRTFTDKVPLVARARAHARRRARVFIHGRTFEIHASGTKEEGREDGRKGLERRTGQGEEERKSSVNPEENRKKSEIQPSGGGERRRAGSEEEEEIEARTAHGYVERSTRPRVILK